MKRTVCGLLLICLLGSGCATAPVPDGLTASADDVLNIVVNARTKLDVEAVFGAKPQGSSVHGDFRIDTYTLKLNEAIDAEFCDWGAKPPRWVSVGVTYDSGNRIISSVFAPGDGSAKLLPEGLGQLKKGRSTIRDVVAIFGCPTSHRRLRGASSIFEYRAGKNHMGGSGMIDGYAYHNYSKMDQTVINCAFNPAGIMTNFSSEVCVHETYILTPIASRNPEFISEKAIASAIFHRPGRAAVLRAFGKPDAVSIQPTQRSYVYTRGADPSSTQSVCFSFGDNGELIGTSVSKPVVKQDITVDRSAGRSIAKFVNALNAVARLTHGVSGTPPASGTPDDTRTTVTSGEDVDPELVQRALQGKLSRKEVFQMLGYPSSSAWSKTGEVVDNYSFMTSIDEAAFSSSFLTIKPELSAVTEYSYQMLTYGADGKLKDVRSGGGMHRVRVK